MTEEEIDKLKAEEPEVEPEDTEDDPGVPDDVDVAEGDD